MKRNVYRIMLGMGWPLLVISGCGNQGIGGNAYSEMTEESEEMERDWMTKEYIIEHGLATEEELEGVDVDAMIKDCGLEKGMEDRYNLPLLIELSKKDYIIGGYEFDYQYLVDTEKSKNKLTDDDMNCIKTIGFECNEGTYFASMIFDLSEGAAYFGDGVDLLRKGAKPTPEDRAYGGADRGNQSAYDFQQCAGMEKRVPGLKYK